MSSGVGDREAKRLEAEHLHCLARVWRIIHRHHLAPIAALMVVKQIDVACIFALKAKRHAPIATHIDCPVPGKVALQGV